MSQFSVDQICHGDNCHRSMSCWNTIATAYLKILSSAFLKYLLYWTLFVCLVQFQGLNVNYLLSEGKNNVFLSDLTFLSYLPSSDVKLISLLI